MPLTNQLENNMQKLCYAFSNNSTVLDDDDFFIFLSRESDGDAMNRTNPEFQTHLGVAFVSDFSA